MQTEEIWVDVPEFSEYYQVSNHGRFRSKFWRVGGKFKSLEELKLKQNRDGYLFARFHFDKKQHLRNAHRIVATCFIPNPQQLPQVNHKDLDKTNNRVENLEWCSCKENMLHLIGNGSRKASRANVKQLLEENGLLFLNGEKGSEREVKYRKAYKRAMKLGLI